MQPKTLFSLFLCLFFLPFAISAQDGDLLPDEAFFNEQADTYQRWLDHTGLGEKLQVREIEVKEEMLTLFLEFPYQEIDSIVRAWERLKMDFDTASPITLEQQLFYKMVSLMEVRQSMAQVVIFDTYDLRKEPLFLRGIYFEDGQVKVEESNPKSKIREVQFTPAKLNRDAKKMSVEAFKKKYNREYVYNTIYEFAKQHFERKKCDQRYPEVRLLENDENLHFEVMDLCREVLTDAANPLLCQILQKFGHDCNWVKREKLDLLIVYQEETEGFRLHVTIDGKYGSGLYSKVDRGAYLSMEIDFDEYLEVYADQFKERLKDSLKDKD